ncbi:hypothetical protein [Vibrio parahaemolyticus]|uniref:hypothetical protein n=1 Tax=Vibrio parahaemolyticus TaxID=670 RepID=UPI001850D651|nr:hypothetical protein [Vibrio parahaemolyticus]MCR9664081.1 hypothetical protein [Vibrio parahaemolyticus]MCR9676972.1 hypothetical protein [Vibrio parahaemolyticus]MDF4947866.1 hypothetical protein [Vibrio parahaemolyticus]MDF4986286.1 hypothetical protein [Vibrio parahaemolyticus]MDF5090842.1 hypothetical protein [Vibrio parahaemolyticus]
MRRLIPFYRSMLFASALSWVLVTLMPVINAHGNSMGVWATLCTLNGFELVQIEEGDSSVTHKGKPCPFSYFSTFHQDSLPTTPILSRLSSVISERYTFLALSVRFETPVPRAPPVVSFS